MSRTHPGSLFSAALALLTSCTATQRYPALNVLEDTALVTNPLAGDTNPVRDPSVIFANGTYSVFSTDPATPGEGQSALRCSGNALTWQAPGGGTAYVDEASGDSLLAFHAFNTAENANSTLRLKTITWQNNWPLLN